MVSTLKIWCSGIVILGAVYMCHTVFGISCSTEADCPLDSYTNCSGSKCLCVENFANNNGICRNTTTDNANAHPNPVAVSSTSCQQIGDCNVAHSECDTSAHNCKCSDGFVASTPGGESCVNAPVATLACTQITDCKVAHSECDTSAHNCKCSDGFVASTPGGESCVNAPVSSVTCKQNTDCKVEHSVCDTTASQCTCSEGFKQSSSGTCDKESAAVTARLSTLSIGVSMTLFLFVHKRY